MGSPNLAIDTQLMLSALSYRAPYHESGRAKRWWRNALLPFRQPGPVDKLGAGFVLLVELLTLTLKHIGLGLQQFRSGKNSMARILCCLSDRRKKLVPSRVSQKMMINYNSL